MYFQLGRVRTYTDFRVWQNNYDILATTGKPGNGATVAPLLHAGDNPASMHLLQL